jgi:hypothetical protein
MSVAVNERAILADEKGPGRQGLKSMAMRISPFGESLIEFSRGFNPGRRKPESMNQ